MKNKKKTTHQPTWAHNLHQGDDLLMVFAGSQHPLQKEDLEIGEHVRRLAAHHLHQLRRQLEGRRLEAKVTWRGGEHEAEVDVYDVSLVVQENVAIVSVIKN